jgi:hypothetical protein
MFRKPVLLCVIALACAAAIAIKAAEATDLFEPYLKVYGTIRPTLTVHSGRSVGHAESQLNRIFLNIDKDFADGKFGFHTETQYQQEGLGGYPNEAWLEEAYFYFNPAFGKIKLGKIYTSFGIGWDHTFYGSIVYYKGFMADPDYGMSFERTETINKDKGIDLKWKAAYFVREDDLNGQTNISEGFEYLNRGERNTFVLRLNPGIQINDKSSLRLGLSALTGQVKTQETGRQAAVEMDAAYTFEPLTLTGEYVFYDRAYSGKDDTLRGDCYLVEAYLDVYKKPESKFLKKIALNYNYSRDNPDHGTTTGQIHLAAVIFTFMDKFNTRIEYVDWTKDGATSDRSWWAVFSIDF